MSGRDLAERAGWHESKVSKLEYGRRPLRGRSPSLLQHPGRGARTAGTDHHASKYRQCPRRVAARPERRHKKWAEQAGEACRTDPADEDLPTLRNTRTSPDRRICRSNFTAGNRALSNTG
ncbi:helix-turn-helix transcriptional regulator [Nocardia sp. NPDC004568]|uniref:helix-turn-helix domain-containing protein n=1 Tax=Nocardia sp. NPDC004568 TaxID=3154551 RepID=UPI0033A154FA